MWFCARKTRANAVRVFGGNVLKPKITTAQWSLLAGAYEFLKCRDFDLFRSDPVIAGALDVIIKRIAELIDAEVTVTDLNV